MNMGNRGGERPDDNDFKNMEPPASDGNDSFSKSRFVGGNMPEKFDTFSFGDMPPNEKGESDFRVDEHTEASDERGDAKRMPGTGGFDRSKSGGFSMGGNGANLNYIDKDTDSYSTIWEGEVTKTTKSDHKRVVKALQNISEGTDIEKYMDVDNLLKYMAVHVFSVNEDSLLGMMAHNYYLYESDGQLNILPWDYNLALGGMGGKNRSDSATSTINDAIDYAFSGTEFFDTLMEDEEYNKIYYGYLKQLVEKYIYGGGFEDFYHTTRNRIDSLVKSDPTAFYTYEEYEKAADTLYEVVQLRAKSISGQLAGTIPSTEKEQIDSDSLVDASHLDLSVMGSMSMNDSMRNWDGADAAPQLDGRELPDGFDRGNAGETVADNLILFGMCSIVLLIAIVFAKLYRRRFRYR
ncbi:MAG: hypothetical protein HFH14_03930 [Lachnospiraceae bacterium]|nr:hypothetical protein [Lachnospiraceae bacterium]